MLLEIDGRRYKSGAGSVMRAGAERYVIYGGAGDPPPPIDLHIFSKNCAENKTNADLADVMQELFNQKVITKLKDDERQIIVIGIQEWAGVTAKAVAGAAKAVVGMAKSVAGAAKSVVGTAKSVVGRLNSNIHMPHHGGGTEYIKLINNNEEYRFAIYRMGTHTTMATVLAVYDSVDQGNKVKNTFHSGYFNALGTKSHTSVDIMSQVTNKPLFTISNVHFPFEDETNRNFFYDRVQKVVEGSSMYPRPHIVFGDVNLRSGAMIKDAPLGGKITPTQIYKATCADNGLGTCFINDESAPTTDDAFATATRIANALNADEPNNTFDNVWENDIFNIIKFVNKQPSGTDSYTNLSEPLPRETTTTQTDVPSRPKDLKPTYKLNATTSKYDLIKDNNWRVPGFPDRIFFRTLSQSQWTMKMDCIDYRSLAPNQNCPSDHLPIYGHYTITHELPTVVGVLKSE